MKDLFRKQDESAMLHKDDQMGGFTKEEIIALTASA